MGEQISNLVVKGVYNLLFCLLLPLIVFKLHTSGSGGQGFAGRWREHFGFVPAIKQPKVVWLHAASVGEVVVATPLIKALKQQYPQLQLLLTTTTRTGADQAAKLAAWAEHRYAPLDCPAMVERFLQRVKPHALLLIETERWLNYMLACERQQIPVVVINGRVSPRSFKRYQYVKSFFRLWSRPITRLLMQHQTDVERLITLGVPREKCLITGSIKFDISFAPDITQQGQLLRAAWGNRVVWIAASTHEQEEEQVLHALETIRADQPDSLLILVPRHPQRFDTVFALCKSNGWIIARRSLQEAVQTTTHIYLGDTMGELPMLLAAADVAFVGGSLVAIGGHNLLEPAALGKPCLTGPHYFNFRDITEQLVANNGAQVVQNAAELATSVITLFKQPQQRHLMGQAALQVVEANRGALAKTLQALAEVLPL